MMEAVSLHHHHGALPAALPPLNHHHHRSSLPVHPIPHTTTTSRRPVCATSSSKPPSAACVTESSSHAHARSDHPSAAAAGAHYSSRAATGYAAALADACVRAGTLRRASRNARALLFSRRQEEQEMDTRVAALVRMLVGKGKAGMVAEVMAEFAAICDKLLPRPQPQFHAAY